MALMQIDLSEKGERNIKKYQNLWNLNKLATAKKMIEEFEANPEKKTLETWVSRRRSRR